jgi:hypothetical protein
MARSLLLILSLTIGSLTAAEWTYQWKPAELYRFELTRTVAVQQPDEKGIQSERRTEFTGVMILEIRSVSSGIATALLRFDNPRIKLPIQRVFGAQDDDMSENAKRSESVALAMKAAIQAARWSVTLNPNGSMRIDSRVPEKFADWTKELGNVGRWRFRLGDVLNEILENDMGLKIGGLDSDLLYVRAQPAPTTPAMQIRPLRAPISAPSGKVILQQKFERKYDALPADGYEIPAMAGGGKIRMKPSAPATQEGLATFDSRLGMLDALSENYTVPVVYTFGPDTLNQQVTVTYKITRIAPAITPVE